MFAGATKGALEKLAGRCTTRVIAKGEFLFHQGDPGDALYVVRDGLMKLAITSREGDEVAFRTVGAAGTFGELSALDGGPRSTSAQAVRPTELLGLPGDDLRDAMRREPTLAECVLCSVIERLRATSRQHADLVFLELPARVAGYLLEQAAGTPPVVTLDLSQADLGALLGGARQSVNQVLRGFELDGLLRRTGSRVEIIDRDGLVARLGSP